MATATVMEPARSNFVMESRNFITIRRRRDEPERGSSVRFQERRDFGTREELKVFWSQKKEEAVDVHQRALLK